MDENLQYFFPNSENVETLTRIIKSQGVRVCREKISVEWINDKISKYDFGFAFVLPKAQIGRRFDLKGFILCRIKEDSPNTILIDIVCSTEVSRVGKVLMELAENFVKTNENYRHIRGMALLSLPDETLKNWYRNLG